MRKTLEDYKSELLGKKFGRLTVLDVQPYIMKSGKTNGCKVVCQCDCGKQKIVYAYGLIKGHTQSCGCLQKEKARNNIKEALKWNNEHPKEMKIIRDKGIQSMLKWQKENPEKSKEQKMESVKKALQWQEDHPEECRQFLEKAHQWQKEHPEEFKSFLDFNIEKAHQWNESHLEEMKIIRKRGVASMQQWHREHTEESKNFLLTNLKKAHQWNTENKQESLNRIQQGKKDIYVENISGEEKEILEFLLSLGYEVEHQFLLDNHYFDFRINNFLIEYNGSVYHYTDYKNIDNPSSKRPPSIIKEDSYHLNLRDTAIKNGYHLIQIWDYDWINNKDFIQKLIKDQLNGTANYKDYIEDTNLLNNDYGFNVEGDPVKPKSKWVATSNPKKVVDESYSKGKVLIYNSGYTTISSI